MSDVVEFLERVGQDAQLSRGVKGEFELALASASLDPKLQEAIRIKDHAKLKTLMGIAPAFVFLAPGEEQEDDAEETPSREEDEVSSALDGAELLG